MKARILPVLVMLLAIVPFGVPYAMASTESTVAVSSFFTALNAGDQEAAVAAFTPDAEATLVRGETYRGADGISHMVDLMDHPGRRYEIIQTYTTGDTMTIVVEVSDQGIRWGEDTIVVGVREGKLHTFQEKAFDLRLGA